MITLYFSDKDDAQKAYAAMRGKSDKFTVYRRAQVPASLHFDSNPREGDPVIVANGPYYISATADPNGRGALGGHARFRRNSHARNEGPIRCRRARYSSRSRAAAV